MDFLNSFVPTAAQVGVLPMVTYYCMIVAFYAFVGSFLSAVMTRGSVAPEHRVSRDFTAIIAAVAGISYFIIQDDYRHMLGVISHLRNPADREVFMHASYQAIGQYRYMDWAVTTPLLLLKAVTMLKVKPHEAKSSIFWLLLADVFMIVTGYIGEQQLGANGSILVGNKLMWGAISTVGYIFIPIILFSLWKRFAERAQPEERRAFKIMGLCTVTLWGVYPVGYLLTMLPNFDLNWVHISFTIADILNKVGIGVVAYLASKSIVEKRVLDTAVQNEHTIS